MFWARRFTDCLARFSADLMFATEFRLQIEPRILAEDARRSTLAIVPRA